MTMLGTSDLDVFPLCLGGNVFGWTADEATPSPCSTPTRPPAATSSTPPTCYSAWVPGQLGRRVGDDHRQLAEPRAATATSGHRDQGRATNSRPAPRGDPRGRRSARSSGCSTDRIDLYYMHNDDPETPLEESLGAFGELVRGRQGRATSAPPTSAPSASPRRSTSPSARGCRRRRAAERVQPGRRAATRTSCATSSRERGHRRGPVLRPRVRAS